MKIKLITTSTSAIGYLKKSKSICCISDIIKYSQNEEYNDFLDVSSENFYNRLIYDKFANPKVYPGKSYRIKEECNKAISEGYEAILFLIPSVQILDYRGVINQALLGMDISYEILDSKTIGYPLAYLAIEAQKLIDEGLDLSEIKNKIGEMANNTGIILYAYNNEIEIPLGSRIEDLVNLEMDRRGKLYMLESGRLLSIKHDKKKPMVIEMLENFYKLTKGSLTIPFISYTQPTTYKRLLESKLLLLYEGLDKITEIPLPAALGTKLGASIIAIGYIRK